MLVRVQSCAPKYKKAPRGPFVFWLDRCSKPARDCSRSGARSAKRNFDAHGSPMSRRRVGNGNLVLVRVQSCAPVSPLCSADGGVATGLVVPMTTSSLGSLPSTPQSGKTTSTFNGVLLLLGSSPVLRTSFTTLQRRRRRRYGTRAPDGSSPVLRGAFVEGLSSQFFFVLKCCYEQAFVEKVFR